jgi:Holliday junction resolvasome RuvABC DNA-binding subunit
MNDFIEKLTGALAPLFQYLEHEVIIDVARRIRDTMHYTATAELQAKAMKELGFSPNKIRAEAMKTLNADKKYRKEVAKNTLGFKRKVRNLIAGIRKKAMKEGDELFTGAADTINNANLATWRSEGKEITDSSYLPELVNSIQEQTHGEIENITRTTGFQGMSGYESIENLYRKELDKAVIKIMSGTFSQEQVVADVVHNLAKSGLRSIDFASGHSMQLDTAVRLALRTSVHQLQAKINDENILRSGENLVYVSKHWGARNKGTGVENHESWQGKVYYIKPGKDYSREASRIGQSSIDDLWEATGYSIDGAHENNPLGLNGYNCRHMVRVWYEGASSLPDEDPVPPSAVYNGREYDYYAQTQKMRRMEREVRALRREKEALEVLGYDTDEIDVKVKQKRREYSEFCEACLQKEQPERMRYECKTSNLKKTKAWKEYGEEKGKALGASNSSTGSNSPQYIGQIDIDKIEQAVNYYGNLIRNSATEQMYVIDNNGNVYYNIGSEKSVGIGSINLSDCTVLHNHPASNGIVSFGEDDFNLIREYQSASYRLVNEKYDYRLEVIKSIDNITYNQAWLWGVTDVSDVENVEDMQHCIMQSLKKRGYIRYEQKRIDTESEK